MALKITNRNGIFELEGNVIGKNAVSLKQHFERLMITKEKMILSLDCVKQIDHYGIQVLTSLYKSAMKNNKIFYVLRSTNKEINNAFGQVNYILKSDFL